MLGEKIGSISGPVTNKVLSAEGSLPKFSTSTEGAGTLAGAEVQSMATYSSTMRADGTLYGECPNQGVIMTQDGVATFRATGMGTFTADGGSIFRGACYFKHLHHHFQVLMVFVVFTILMLMQKEMPLGIFGSGTSLK